MAKKSVSIKYGTLTRPLQSYNLKPGTTLMEFLTSHELKYSSAIRVNGNVVAKSARLNSGDIITSTETVSGGI